MSAILSLALTAVSLAQIGRLTLLVGIEVLIGNAGAALAAALPVLGKIRVLGAWALLFLGTGRRAGHDCLL
jgi:hypothetical protein